MDRLCHKAVPRQRAGTGSVQPTLRRVEPKIFAEVLSRAPKFVADKGRLDFRALKEQNSSWTFLTKAGNKELKTYTMFLVNLFSDPL